MLAMDSPEAVGLHPERWAAALELVRDWCDRDLLPSAGVVVGRGDRMTKPALFGRQHLADAPASIRDDAIFLIASITKPIVAMGACLLIERGQLLLGERVHEFIPEFGGERKYATTIRHLLTHTSGLPDMLPNNRQLRAAGAPLHAFVEDTCDCEPAFAPGRGVQYQSMGFALLGEIIARVSGRSCPQFLREEIFEPLGMHDTALGAPESWFQGTSPRIARVPEIRVPADQTTAHDWNWNSRYWRMLGAPWGGLLTTPADLGTFAALMLNRGRIGDRTLFSPATVDAAVRNQLEPMRDVPEEDRRCKPWGLGWRLNWPAHSENFGDLLSPHTYGHWGATGTVFWIDPEHQVWAVILTTQPMEPHGRYLARLSNAIAAAIV
ncbi:MAG: beta-lactamase family protein [Planctomycetaceae bacterium]|nr:beta-lactamase family protein [Planctomycetaceae bacterium]